MAENTAAENKERYTAPTAEQAKLIDEIKSRPKENIECKRILVPTDGSGQAFKAVNQAIHMAAVTGAELTVMMAVDLNRNISAFEQVSLSGYIPAELKVAAFQFLADLMHVIPSEVKAHTRVEVGDPGECIADVAEEEESDLIIMGCRGFGTIRSLLVGSVSNYVMKHVTCPVLLVKGMPDDWDDEDNFIVNKGKE